MLKTIIRKVVALTISIIIIFQNIISCSARDTKSHGNDETIRENTIYEISNIENTIYETFIIENINYEINVYEIEINKYEFSEYINGIYLTELRTLDYIMAQSNLERELKIGQITVNFAIGVAVTIPILLVVPPMTVVTNVLIGMAVDATITGFFSYMESGGNSRETLYGVIEGVADGFKWGVVMSLAMEYLVAAKTGRIARTALKHVDDIPVSGRDIGKTQILMPTRIANSAESVNILIPNNTRNVFRNIPDTNQLPRGWNKLDFDNSKGILTRSGPKGEPISYSMYISGNGDKVIVGSDGVQYYVKGDIIKSFDDVPEFVTRSGNSTIRGYTGSTTSDGVSYVQKIVYDSKDNLVRVEVPVFPGNIKVSLPYEDFLKHEREQYRTADRLLVKMIKDNADFAELVTREFGENAIMLARSGGQGSLESIINQYGQEASVWLSLDTESAIRRFGQKAIEMLNKGESVGNIGYYSWHHLEDVGQLQLVSRTVHHPGNNHVGGYEIWGIGRGE